MVIIYVVLFIIPPVFLILWLSSYLVKENNTEAQKRNRVLFWLGCAILTLIFIIVTSYAALVQHHGVSPLAILAGPALEGALTLLILQWRDIYNLWQKEKVVITIALGLLLGLIVLFSILEITLVLVVLVLPLILAGLWTVIQRSGFRGMIVAAFCVLVFEILLAAGVLNPAYRMTGWLDALWGAFELLVTLIAVMLAFYLVMRGIDALQNNTKLQAVARFTLASFLILGVMATIVSFGMMVKATAHIDEDNLPFGQIAFSVVIGMLFIANQRAADKRQVGFGLTVLVPLLFILSYSAGFLFNPQGITLQRAENIRQAINRYHEQTGIYPAALSDLTPKYMLFIPEPLNGRGQVWCYQGAEDAYRLGYVFIQGYYPPSMEPFVEIRIFSQAGTFPSSRWMCDDELERGKANLGL